MNKITDYIKILSFFVVLEVSQICIFFLIFPYLNSKKNSVFDELKAVYRNLCNLTSNKLTVTLLYGTPLFSINQNGSIILISN